MWKKIAIGAAVAAATLGVGTAALAASGSTTAGSPSPSTKTAGAAAKHPAGRGLARGAIHGQWVTGKVGSTTFTTHDEIRGQVSAVSPTSITVKAIDNVSQTYAINSDTKVRVRTAGKGAAGSIGQVKSGEHVVVRGTGTGTLTATGVLVVTK